MITQVKVVLRRMSTSPVSHCRNKVLENLQVLRHRSGLHGHCPNRQLVVSWFKTQCRYSGKRSLDVDHHHQAEVDVSFAYVVVLVLEYAIVCMICVLLRLIYGKETSNCQQAARACATRLDTRHNLTPTTTNCALPSTCPAIQPTFHPTLLPRSLPKHKSLVPVVNPLACSLSFNHPRFSNSKRPSPS